MDSLSPRSPFVTGLAIVSLVIAASMFVSDIVGLISYINLTNSSEYQMAMKLMQTYQPNSDLMLGNSQWVLGSSIVGLVLNIGSVVVSYGLFVRKSWGRISYLSLLIIQTVYYIFSSIVGFYWADTILNATGIAGSVSSEIVGVGRLAAIVGMIIVLATAAFIIRKLSAEEVKKEFISKQ